MVLPKLGAVDIFTSSPLSVHWTFRGEEVEASQDLDVRVGSLGQNQNNVLKKTYFTNVEHEEKNVPQ